MEFSRTGVILNVDKYAECVSFYRDLFQLKIMFQQNEDDFKLTYFDFQGSYLMIEMGGVFQPREKTMQESCTKLRFNVDNIEGALQTVISYGIDAKILKSVWGSTINVCDPDGNRIGIRDEETFSNQIKH